jgi:cytochrome c
MKAALLFTVLSIFAGCAEDERVFIVASTGGDVESGRALIRRVGCGSCHTIPGIREANGKVAPPLSFFAERTYIAGRVPNTPANLVLWISNPPAVDALTAMPNLGLTEQQSRDVAAYLYTLK